MNVADNLYHMTCHDGDYEATISTVHFGVPFPPTPWLVHIKHGDIDLNLEAKQPTGTMGDYLACAYGCSVEDCQSIS
jgi:hypothetical protein